MHDLDEVPLGAGLALREALDDLHEVAADDGLVAGVAAVGADRVVGSGAAVAAVVVAGHALAVAQVVVLSLGALGHAEGAVLRGIV